MELVQFSPCLLSALIAFVVSLLLVTTKRWHGKYSFDPHIGTQKFHSIPTPRVGGISIFIALLGSFVFCSLPDSKLFAKLLIAALPVFFIGISEDITKRVSVRLRYIAILLGSIIAFWLTGYRVMQIEIVVVDSLLVYLPLSLAFTLFAVTGLTNSINIIDGFNGLASGTLIICFSALGIIAWDVGDIQVVHLCLIMISCVLGFFVVNFPLGKIFMGDGGAYLCGFMLAWVAIMLPIRNPKVSSWAPLLACAYPIIETIFSMFRRYKNKTSVSCADSAHFHSLIKIKIIRPFFKKSDQCMRNSMVAPICWAFALIPSCIAIALYDNTAFLMFGGLISLSLYALLYWLVSKVQCSITNKESLPPIQAYQE